MERIECLGLMCVIASFGSAAALVDGETAHHALGLTVTGNSQQARGQDTMKPETLNRLREEWMHRQLLGIDEISLIGGSLLHQINTRLQLIKGNNQPFGGLHVLFFGDFHQLWPVRDKPLWFPTEKLNWSAKAGQQAWITKVTAVTELTQIMRQADEQEWAELLRRMRTGHSTDADREVIKAIAARHIDFETDEWRAAVLLTPRNSVREGLSSYCTRRDAQAQGIPVVKWSARYTRHSVAVALSESLRTAEGQNVGPHEFFYAPMMPVMLLSNQVAGPNSVAMGMANGVVGQALALVLDAREPPILAPQGAAVQNGLPILCATCLLE